jgi:hypothetical protein
MSFDQESGGTGKTFTKGGREYPALERFLAGWMRTSTAGKKFQTFLVDKKITLEEGERVMVYLAKSRRSEASPQYYGFRETKEQALEQERADARYKEEREGKKGPAEEGKKDPADDF